MDSQTSLAVITTIVGAGGLATILTVLTKYWIDKRKVEDQSKHELVQQLQARILQLEEEHTECLRNYATLSQRVGFLEGSIRYLEKKLQLSEDNRLENNE